jgi:C-terminal processing protease CtpA/Prc
VSLRWIEDQPVVTRILDANVATTMGIEVGDVIVSIEGEEVGRRVAEISKYVSASTPQALMRRVCSLLLAGPENSTIRVKVRKAGGELKEVELARKGSSRQQRGEREGAIFRLLEGNIGYADLDRLSAGMVDEMFEKFRETRAIIFDMRGYPNGTAWVIAPRLSQKKSPIAAQFRRPIVMYPEGEAGDVEQVATYSFSQRIPAGNEERVYDKPTIMLIDERTISQAEHTGLFLLAANGTRFIGTPSNGANGDVTSFIVPGGIRVSMTGHDVRHADGRQLQRIGLKPDITVAPTIAGIAAGRDEVLEFALKHLNGGDKTE